MTIDDDLLRQAKSVAARTGRNLGDVVDDALRALLVERPKSAGCRVTLPTWDGTQESTIGLPIPNDVSLVDVEVFAQGAFVDIAHTAAEDFRFTNALHMVIGAP